MNLSQEQLDLIAEIEKPIIKLMQHENGTPILTAAYFDVEVRFINNTYPVLSYTSKPYKIDTAESSGVDLIVTLLDNVKNWKLKHDTLREKQSIVDNFLSNVWGA